MSRTGTSGFMDMPPPMPSVQQHQHQSFIARDTDSPSGLALPPPAPRASYQQKKQGFTPEVLRFLKDWLKERMGGDYLGPLPRLTEEDKLEVMQATGLRHLQVVQWFTNRRKDHRLQTLERFINS